MALCPPPFRHPLLAEDGGRAQQVSYPGGVHLLSTACSCQQWTGGIGTGNMAGHFCTSGIPTCPILESYSLLSSLHTGGKSPADAVEDVCVYPLFLTVFPICPQSALKTGLNLVQCLHALKKLSPSETSLQEDSPPFMLGGEHLSPTDTGRTSLSCITGTSPLHAREPSQLHVGGMPPPHFRTGSSSNLSPCQMDGPTHPLC